MDIPVNPLYNGILKPPVPPPPVISEAHGREEGSLVGGKSLESLSFAQPPAIEPRRDIKKEVITGCMDLTLLELGEVQAYVNLRVRLLQSRLPGYKRPLFG